MTRPTPTRKKDSPAAYEDVKFVLDMAVKKPDLLYVCETVGQAIHFKQRCNTYRKLLREQQAEISGLIPGHRPESLYDILVISQVNGEGEPDRQGAVLKFRHEKLHGRLIDPDTGKEIDIPNSFITGKINDDF